MENPVINGKHPGYYAGYMGHPGHPGGYAHGYGGYPGGYAHGYGGGYPGYPAPYGRSYSKSPTRGKGPNMLGSSPSREEEQPINGNELENPNVDRRAIVSDVYQPPSTAPLAAKRMSIKPVGVLEAPKAYRRKPVR